MLTSPQKATLPNLKFLYSLGLFHRVVLLSGSALSPWATVHNADALRVSIGQQTGCLAAEDPSDEDIAPCLQSRWAWNAANYQLFLRSADEGRAGADRWLINKYLGYLISGVIAGRVVYFLLERLQFPSRFKLAFFLIYLTWFN